MSTDTYTCEHGHQLDVCDDCERARMANNTVLTRENSLIRAELETIRAEEKKMAGALQKAWAERDVAQRERSEAQKAIRVMLDERRGLLGSLDEAERQRDAALQRAEKAEAALPHLYAEWAVAADKKIKDATAELDAERNAARARAERLEREKNGAYSERNQCVALIARMALELGLKAGIRQHPAEDLAWENDWRTIVMVDLPSGQCSWHFHDSERHLLEGLPEYSGTWDGHDTAEKYRRVGSLGQLSAFRERLEAEAAAMRSTAEDLCWIIEASREEPVSRREIDERIEVAMRSLSDNAGKALLDERNKLRAVVVEMMKDADNVCNPHSDDCETEEDEGCTCWVGRARSALGEVKP